MPIFAQLLQKISVSALLNSVFPGQMLNKFKQDAEALLSLLMSAFTRQNCIPFQNAKVVNFDVCKKLPK